MKNMSRVNALASAFVAAGVCSPAAAQMSCQAQAGLGPPDTTINLAQSLPAWANPAPVGTIPVAICRVAGKIAPTSDSDIRFEVWLPLTGWNGKFLSAGEGGFAGAINYAGILGAIQRGYAGGSTDTGHVGGTADFAPGHPEKGTDFGFAGAEKRPGGEEGKFPR